MASRQDSTAAVASLEWRLTDFGPLLDSLSAEQRPCLTSRPLRAPQFPSQDFFLQLYPNGSAAKYAGQLSVYLNLTKPLALPADTVVSFAVKLGDKESALERGAADLAKNGYGWPQLASHAAAKAALAEGALVLKCRLSFVASALPDSEALPPPRPGAFLFSERFSDATLIVEEANFRAHDPIPVHRLVLATHSAVFAAMLGADMREGRTGLVKVKGARLADVQALLRFMYTGDVDAVSKSPASLLALANQYDVAGLKRACEAELLGRLTGATLCGTARLACDCASARLTAACQDLLAKGEAVDKKAWAELERTDPHAVCAIARRFVTFASEKDETKTK